MKAIFTTQVESAYNDKPEDYYHFPRSYLSRVQPTQGDFIIYYEPRRTRGSNTGGRLAYFATAKIERIEQDARQANHYYAFTEQGSFLEFPHPVPISRGGHYWEAGLPGSSRNAVRHIQDHEYLAIVQEGMGTSLVLDLPQEHAYELQEAQVPFERSVEKVFLNRKVRDRAFMAVVRDAYNSTCAFTGLRLINGGGRSEIEAAHIQPVGGEHAGPDSVRNGLALSRTFHWMFDRGLLSLEDDGKILFSKRSDDAFDRVRGLLHPDGYARFPDDGRLKPHNRYLRYHREVMFKE